VSWTVFVVLLVVLVAGFVAGVAVALLCPDDEEEET